MRNDTVNRGRVRQTVIFVPGQFKDDFAYSPLPIVNTFSGIIDFLPRPPIGLVALLLALPLLAQVHWEFADINGFERYGQVDIAAGPRPPEFPDFTVDNAALRFAGKGARLMLPDRDNHLDFAKGEAITIEAWVNLAGGTAHPMYIVGKGRTNDPKFAADNQNWSLRLVSENELATLSFLFASPGGGTANWHRWTSTTGFPTFNGWHHVAVAYRFGVPATMRGWIDGKPTDGRWDLGGATEEAPVVDDDAIWIGSSLGGSAGNSFVGTIDSIRIHRDLLDDAIMGTRFKRVGPRRKPGPAMPEIALSGDQVAAVLMEDNTEICRFSTDGFLLPRIPARFDSWGIRSAWKAPVRLRLAADIQLPAGNHRFLIRARSTSRLWIDGELVVQTQAAKVGARDGEEPLRDLDPPPLPGHRVQAYRHQQVFGEVPLNGSRHRVVFELLVGGKDQRTEIGEICVAWLDGDIYRILGNDLPLTDAAIEPALAEIASQLDNFDTVTRRQAAKNKNGYWAMRHAAARDWAAANPAPAVPGAGNPIDAFIAAKIASALAESAKAGPKAADFHDQVLPILREECFRCHGDKDKGDLKLDSREAALKALVPGKPEESELIYRLRTDDEDERMPPKGDGLSAAAVSTLEAWIADGAPWPAAPVSEQQVAFAPVISDAAFLRRVYLDTVGVPPSPDEARAFLAQPDRDALIDRLLTDPRRADNWMGFWQDLTAENPTLINASLNSTGPFRWFILDALRDHKPIDRLVTELLMMRGDKAYGGSAGFAMAAENDSPFAAKGHIVASGFLGIELQCARCHDSPYHSTKQQDLYALAAMLDRKSVQVPMTSRVPAGFFAKNKGRESLIVVTLEPGAVIKPIWPFEEATGVADDAAISALMQNPNDSRERLATLITAPGNRRFARVMVNRVWKRFIGAGFVEPLHDWEGKAPSHPKLLDWLAHDFVAHGYDLRRLERWLLTSQLYQRQAQGGFRDFFNAPEPRRLTAEQIVDSLHACTGNAMDVEPLTFVHDGRRSMDKRLTLGRPTRAWMFASLNNERDRPSLALPRAQAVVDVLEAFGWTGSRQKPIAQREIEPNVLQPGILANGVLGHNLTRVSHGSELAELAIAAESATELVDTLFLRILTRTPQPEERAAFARALEEGFDARVISDTLTPKAEQPRLRLVHWFNHLRPDANSIQLEHERRLRAGPMPDPRLAPAWREAYEDVIWSLINHREFVWMP
jgi:cytochrome c553